MTPSSHKAIEIERENASPPPGLAKRWRSHFIQGIGKPDGGLIALLDVEVVDIDRAFSSAELAPVAEAVHVGREIEAVH